MNMEMIKNIMLPVALIGVFYFLMIRPQQQKAKKHQEMLKALKRGDRVVTSGGIVGSVARVVNENEIILSVSQEVELTVLRGSIVDVRSEGASEAVRSCSNSENEKETCASKVKRVLSSGKSSKK